MDYSDPASFVLPFDLEAFLGEFRESSSQQRAAPVARLLLSAACLKASAWRQHNPAHKVGTMTRCVGVGGSHERES